MGGDSIAAGAMALLFVDFGLHLIEDEATLTFIFFLGISLLGALGIRFSYYAEQNMQRTRIDRQQTIWQYLRYIGILGAAYASIWVLEIVSSLGLAAKNGIWLAMILFLVLSLRQISMIAGRGLNDGLGPFDRIARLSFMGAIGIYVIFTSIFGVTRVTALIEGVAGVAFLGYGVFYFRRQTASTRLQGTMLDSLVRHLLPVLTFGALLNIAALAIVAGVDRTIVLHVQLVFLIMTATALMTATIKLRQNLATL